MSAAARAVCALMMLSSITRTAANEFAGHEDAAHHQQCPNPMAKKKAGPYVMMQADYATAFTATEDKQLQHQRFFRA